MYKIAVIPGDGTGPEVVAEGLKALEAASEKYKFKYELEQYDLGGERYLRTGETLSPSVLDELRKMDAIFLGAIGHPDVKDEQVHLGPVLVRRKVDRHLSADGLPIKSGVPLSKSRSSSRKKSGAQARIGQIRKQLESEIQELMKQRQERVKTDQRTLYI
jgi:isocitrate/isopropylmalate dehydrogenase